MKNIFRIIAVVALMMLLSTESAWAGNDRRRGTSGAMELLINPWARSTGWGSANVSCVRGLDAFYSNIAGLSFINTIEVSYTNTLLAGGKSGLNSGASINSFGIAVRLFDQGVLGISLMAMGFGDIDVTTVESPEPINGTYSPTLMNLNFAYAHSFTQSIHGGVNVKIHSESTSNITASAFAVDAGIQYVTGEDDQLKFGISLKNWGPAFSYNGTGLSFQFINDAQNTMSAQYRPAEMELPTCLNIGASDDFFIPVWVYQTDIFNSELSTTANQGLCAGASVNIPMHKKDSDSKMGLTIDYSFRAGLNLKSTHAIGATFRF